MKIGCQFSLYPLRKDHLSADIAKSLQEMKDAGLETHLGPTSTYVEGEDQKIFEALHKAYKEASENADVVMVTTFSNLAPKVAKTELKKI